jgi:hypothetical protein
MSNKIHIYRDIEGWFDYEDLYSEIASKAKDGWQGVEIGCWQGKSASFLAVELANTGKKVDFYCVDTWSGSAEHLNEDRDCYDPRIKEKDWLYNKFLENMRPVEGHFIAKRKSSLEAAKDFLDNSLDFVFIDASHDYDNVMADLEAWYPKMKRCECCGYSKAILAGHDFPFSGVATAVMNFCEKYELTWQAGKKYVSERCWRIIC